MSNEPKCRTCDKAMEQKVQESLPYWLCADPDCSAFGRVQVPGCKWPEERIARCVGSSDLIFGGHPDDEKRARELLRDYGPTEVKKALKELLVARNCKSDHVEQQLDRVDDLWAELTAN